MHLLKGVHFSLPDLHVHIYIHDTSISMEKKHAAYLTLEGLMFSFGKSEAPIIRDDRGTLDQIWS